MKKHHGSCHCGSLKFEVALDASKGGTMCNCSICTKLGSRNAIVKPADFAVTAGEDEASTYGKSEAGTRYFCRTCGVHCFGRGVIEELGGAYVSVNLNCLDDVELTHLPLLYWDGRHDNWQAGPRPAPWPMHASA